MRPPMLDEELDEDDMEDLFPEDEDFVFYDLDFNVREDRRFEPSLEEELNHALDVFENSEEAFDEGIDDSAEGGDHEED